MNKQNIFYSYKSEPNIGLIVYGSDGSVDILFRKYQQL